MPDLDIKHSYSSTSAYQTCPWQYKQVNFMRAFVSESNEAAERGTVMHEHLEVCVDEDTEYPQAEYQWILDDFRAQTGLKIPEMKLAIDRDWCPVDYADPRAWYRGMIDLTCINGAHANVSDLKTGKRKFRDPLSFESWLIERHEGGIETAPQMQANARQAADYALLVFLHFPAIETMDFRFIWSDVPGVKEDLFKFKRSRDSRKLLKTMLATPSLIEHSVEHDEWEYRPSGLCNGFCPVVSCEHWKPKRRRY